MASASNVSSGESLLDYQEMRAHLEKENKELKKKLASFGIFPDSTFLPLKPDSENDLTSSKQAIITATLTDLDSAISSYLPLPGETQGQSKEKSVTPLETNHNNNESISPAKERAERVMMKADLLLERTENLGNTVHWSNNENLEKSLSDYTLTSDGPGETPQRSPESGKQVHIGFRQPRTSSIKSEAYANTDNTKNAHTGSTVGKKLNFYDSSEEELSEIEENSKNHRKKLLTKDDSENNWGRRVVGEIAFQLDRRILQYVFSHRRRLYGFTLRNIAEKINEISFDEHNGCCDMAKILELERKKDTVTKILFEQAQYDFKSHAIFSEHIVNKYGILKVNPCDAKDQLEALKDFNVLKTLVSECIDPRYVKDGMILLNALKAMSVLDRKPILSW